jgi:hypothetical protein
LTIKFGGALLFLYGFPMVYAIGSIKANAELPARQITEGATAAF